MKGALDKKEVSDFLPPQGIILRRWTEGAAFWRMRPAPMQLVRPLLKAQSPKRSAQANWYNEVVLGDIPEVMQRLK